MWIATDWSMPHCCALGTIFLPYSFPFPFTLSLSLSQAIRHFHTLLAPFLSFFLFPKRNSSRVHVVFFFSPFPTLTASRNSKKTKIGQKLKRPDDTNMTSYNYLLFNLLQFLLNVVYYDTEECNLKVKLRMRLLRYRGA